MTKHRYLTEWEVYCHKMGWDPQEKTIADAVAIAPKRDRGSTEKMLQRDHLYSRCDVCQGFICVTNNIDGKPRTPKLKSTILCPSCDPRHPEDRTMNEGYRVLFPDRQRVLRFYLITKAIRNWECPKEFQTSDCKCPVHTARRLIDVS